MADDQKSHFLSAPSSYGTASGRVDVIETHASLLFLAGDGVCKLKRVVKYSYLDFSTAERPRAACEAELTPNRRTAPKPYLKVRAIKSKVAFNETALPGSDAPAPGDPSGPSSSVLLAFLPA